MVNKQKILVVEDEPSIADNLKVSLSRDGFEVSWGSTITAGRELFEEEIFDCLILDVGLPDGSGFDFCREIRGRSDVPVIMLTARSDEIDRVVGLEIGADDYVTKPFSPRELTARVRAILRRVSKKTPELEKANSSLIRIDESSFEVFINDQHVVLSPHEFRLIVILSQSPGRIFSRQQLLEQAWNDPHAAMERTVDAHIKGLRAKIKQAAGRDLIVTHRGFGYSLSLD